MVFHRRSPYQLSKAYPHRGKHYPEFPGKSTSETTYQWSVHSGTYTFPGAGVPPPLANQLIEVFLTSRCGYSKPIAGILGHHLISDQASSDNSSQNGEANAATTTSSELASLLLLLWVERVVEFVLLQRCVVNRLILHWTLLLLDGENTLAGFLWIMEVSETQKFVRFYHGISHLYSIGMQSNRSTPLVTTQRIILMSTQTSTFTPHEVFSYLSTSWFQLWKYGITTFHWIDDLDFTLSFRSTSYSTCLKHSEIPL